MYLWQYSIIRISEMNYMYMYNINNNYLPPLGERIQVKVNSLLETVEL